MKVKEFKKILKPILKECIVEILKEEGLILKEEKRAERKIEQFAEKEDKEYTKKLEESRKKVLSAISSNSYNGVNVFEGVKTLEENEKESSSGVDISGIMKLGKAQNWKLLAGAEKK